MLGCVQAHHCHVPKVEGGLHEAAHLAPRKVVVKTIAKDEKACMPGTACIAKQPWGRSGRNNRVAPHPFLAGMHSASSTCTLFTSYAGRLQRVTTTTDPFIAKEHLHQQWFSQLAAHGGIMRRSWVVRQTPGHRTGRPAGQEGAPPPAVVLHGQLEVGQLQPTSEVCQRMLRGALLSQEHVHEGARSAPGGSPRP